MLVETLLTSLSSQHAKPSTAYAKDATIFHHRLAPHPSQLSVLKKSLTARNCLVASRTHVFAAQSDRAAIHVYALDTSVQPSATTSATSGSLQTVVPLRHKVTSLALAHDGFTLVCGTEVGGLLVWETATGRICQTAEAHLDAVTSLAVDVRSAVLVSGGADGALHVWSLETILAFGDVGRSMENARRNPIRSLRGHTASITGIALGDSGLVVSCAADATGILWNVDVSARLRTILLPSNPTCLSIDPCERAAFFGFEDGSVVGVDFFGLSKPDDVLAGVSNPIWDEQNQTSTVQVGGEAKWKPPSEEVEATTCLDISYDSTKLISGHASGRIVVWDIPTARFSSQLTVHPLPGPISNLVVLPVTGFPHARQALLRLKEVVKPRFGELDSHDGQIPERYRITAQLVGDLGSSHGHDDHDDDDDFIRDMEGFAFPPDVLAGSIAELATWQSIKQDSSQQDNGEVDFMALDGADGVEGDVTDGARNTRLEEENSALRKQVKALRSLHKVLLTQVGNHPDDQALVHTEAADTRRGGSDHEVDIPGQGVASPLRNLANGRTKKRPRNAH